MRSAVLGSSGMGAKPTEGKPQPHGAAGGWEEKLAAFLSGFEHIDDVVGVLACGSYVTGSPTAHSDLDVHIVLDDRAAYRERGNKIVGGLLIEYFANPPRQILRYFEDDFRNVNPCSQTQFATGRILMDKTGDVAALKEKALAMLDTLRESEKAKPAMSELAKYGLWDMLDDLQDAHERDRPDFDFLYFNFLDRMVASYMRSLNRPYNAKTMLGNITDSAVKEKYLLRELPDAEIGSLIAQSITAASRAEKLDAYEKLTSAILESAGGFRIDGFKFKSDLDA